MVPITPLVLVQSQWSSLASFSLQYCFGFIVSIHSHQRQHHFQMQAAVSGSSYYTRLADTNLSQVYGRDNKE